MFLSYFLNKQHSKQQSTINENNPFRIDNLIIITKNQISSLSKYKFQLIIYIKFNKN